MRKEAVFFCLPLCLPPSFLPSALGVGDRAPYLKITRGRTSISCKAGVNMTDYTLAHPHFLPFRNQPITMQYSLQLPR